MKYTKEARRQAIFTKCKMSSIAELCRCTRDESGDVTEWCDACMFGPMRAIRYYIRDDEVAENMEWVIACVHWLCGQTDEWIHSHVDSIYYVLTRLAPHNVSAIKKDIQQLHARIERILDDDDEEDDVYEDENGCILSRSHEAFIKDALARCKTQEERDKLMEDIDDGLLGH